MPDKNDPFRNMSEADIEKAVYAWANKQINRAQGGDQPWKQALCPCPKCVARRQAKMPNQEAFQKSTQAAFDGAGWGDFVKQEGLSEYEQLVVEYRLRAMELAIGWHSGRTVSHPVDLVATAKIIYEFLNTGGEKQVES